MRFTADQLVPLVEVLITRSLALQPLSKRQSYQTTYTLPDLSISAEGRSGARIPPATPNVLIVATVTVLLQLTPPFVDLKARTLPSKQSSIGTMTVPLGCTRGCPPMTQALLAVVFGAPHVLPPSVEVLICTRLLRLWSSNSV